MNGVFQCRIRGLREASQHAGHMLKRIFWAAGLFLAVLCPPDPIQAWQSPGGPLGEIRTFDLPDEARETLALIRKGGPFPYARDGAVFFNREGRLPGMPRGTYREYTVRTPGSRDRGARRIVHSARGEFYYTADHYRSFRRIVE